MQYVCVHGSKSPLSAPSGTESQCRYPRSSGNKAMQLSQKTCRGLWQREALPVLCTPSVLVRLKVLIFPDLPVDSFSRSTRRFMCPSLRPFGHPSRPSIFPDVASLHLDDFLIAVGMLFEGDLNKFASGSGSIPAAGATYDDITRKVH